MKQKLFSGILNRGCTHPAKAEGEAENNCDQQTIQALTKLIPIFIVSFILIIGVVFFNPVLSQNSTDYKVTYSKANSMLVSGNFEEAARLYNVTIQNNPKFTEAYLGLGIAYKESKKYQEAYNAINTALRLNPKYYQAYYNLGIVLENLGRIEEAIDAYDKFLEKVPGAERFSDAKQRISRLKAINKNQ